MEEEKTKKVRPYWHVDLKWITGVLFLVLLGFTLLGYQIYKLTSPKIAIELETLVVASMFSGGNLDKTDDLEEAKKKFPPDAEGKMYPLNGNPNVVIMATDLDTLSPREIRLKLFRQVVEPIYYRGSNKELASTLNDKDAMQQLGLLSLITEKNHKFVKNILLLLILMTSVFLIAFIKFSAGFGRVANPAFIFVLASIPGLFITMVLSSQSGKKPPIPAGGEENGYGQMIASVMSMVGPTLAKQFGSVYIPLAIIGVVLLLVALVGRLVFRKKRN